MEDVLRGVSIYVVLLLLFRLAGRRSMAQASPSDLLLLIVLGETTQKVIPEKDFSFRIAGALIITLLALSRLIDYLMARSGRSSSSNGATAGSVVLVQNGEALYDRMVQAQVTVDDVLAQARSAHGLESMDQIRYAVLEEGGGIGVVPRE